MHDEAGLSERQKAILQYLWDYWREERRPPSYREICQAVKLKAVSAVNYNLKQLEAKGLIEREATSARTVGLTAKGRQLVGGSASVVRSVPMWGTIAAGRPIDLPDTASLPRDVETIEISSAQLPRQIRDLFALRVKGHSMVEDMVDDGDIVVLRQQSVAENGEMVAVWLVDDDTTTLKRFYLKEQAVHLRPANPAFETLIRHPRQVRIMGKVVLVIRQPQRLDG